MSTALHPAHGRWVTASGAWLGIGIGLTTATQLRPVEGLPVGPGEVALAAWCLAMTIEALGRGAIQATIEGWVFFGFWALAFASLGAGWIVGLTTGASTLSAGRDAAAFALSATVFGLVLVSRHAERRLYLAQQSFAWTVLLPCLGFLLLTAGGRLTLGPVAYWYYDIRFEGWAQNPNQLALAMLPIPFWGITRMAHSGGTSGICLGGVMLAGLIGLLGRSDALWLAWAIAAALATALIVGRTLGTARGPRWLAVGLFFVAPLVAVALLIGFGERAWISISGGLIEDYNEHGQGTDRLRRWANVSQAIERSPVIGLGPGSFSGPNAAFEGEEAHNTFLDWTASTGGVGLAAFLALLGFTAYRQLGRGGRAHPLLLGALVVFSSFHYVARQPVFWLALLGTWFAPAPATSRPESSVQEES